MWLYFTFVYFLNRIKIQDRNRTNTYFRGRNRPRVKTSRSSGLCRAGSCKRTLKHNTILCLLSFHVHNQNFTIKYRMRNPGLLGSAVTSYLESRSTKIASKINLSSMGSALLSGNIN